jgi:hypothetical protein
MTKLEFQEPSIEVPLKLKSFYGRVIDQMPLLLSGKNENGEIVDVERKVITPKQVLEWRVKGKNIIDRNLLGENEISTGSVVLVNPNGSGETIVGLYSNPLVKELVHSLNPKSKITRGSKNYSLNGSLRVNSDTYYTIRNDAYIIQPTAANNLRKSKYGEKRVTRGILEYLAEGDQKLLKENLELMRESIHDWPAKDMIIGGLPYSGLKLLGLGQIREGINEDFVECIELCRYNHFLVGVAEKPLGKNNLERRL